MSRRRTRSRRRPWWSSASSPGPGYWSSASKTIPILWSGSVGWRPPFTPPGHPGQVNQAEYNLVVTDRFASPWPLGATDLRGATPVPPTCRWCTEATGHRAGRLACSTGWSSATERSPVSSSTPMICRRRSGRWSMTTWSPPPRRPTPPAGGIAGSSLCRRRSTRTLPCCRRRPSPTGLWRSGRPATRSCTRSSRRVGGRCWPAGTRGRSAPSAGCCPPVRPMSWRGWRPPSTTSTTGTSTATRHVRPGRNIGRGAPLPSDGCSPR